MRSPIKQLLAVTPSDTIDLPFQCLALYVGVSGDVSAVDTNGNTVILKDAPVGWMYDLQLMRINATDTAATDMVIGR